MLEVIGDINLLSKKLNIEKVDFPLFYYPQYNLDKKVEIAFILENEIVIPVSISRHYFLKKIQFIFPPLFRNKRLDENKERFFLNMVIQYLLDHKLADRILPSPTYFVFNSFPDNAVYCPFGTYYLDLTLTNELLWTNVHSKHKNVIRNAEKKGAELKIGKEQIHAFYKLYRSTMERSQLSYESIDFFLNLAKNMLDENIVCAVSYYNNKPQGALLIPYSNYGAYYIYGASAEKIELTGINNYLHWEIIKWLKQKGVKRYDFVGARLSDVSNTRLAGIQMFKERFGSMLERGYIWKMDLTLKCKLYDFLVHAKTKLLRKKVYVDIIDQELSKNK